ncbi:MAG: hypothetical protein WC229_00315 [Candidatus Paceibacterota bacterium]|jgi:hypothetical protein
MAIKIFAECIDSEEEIEVLNNKVNAFIQDKPQAEIQWLQSSAGSSHEKTTVLTSIIRY